MRMLVLRGNVREATLGTQVGDVTISIRVGDNSVVFDGTTTDRQGRFALRVPSGRAIRIAFRRVGFLPLVWETAALSADTVIAIALLRLPTRLDTTTITAGRTGVVGVTFAAGSFRPVPGVRIEITGRPGYVVSDSLGEFGIFGIAPGAHMLRAKHAVNGSAIFSVHAIADQVVDGSVVLDARKVSMPDFMWRDVQQRLAWRRMTSAVISGTDLARYGGTLLDALRISSAVVRSGTYIGNSVCVFIDGLPKPGWPIEALSVIDVETVEVYGTGGEGSGQLAKQWPAASCTESGATARGPVRPADVFIVVWTRP